MWAKFQRESGSLVLIDRVTRYQSLNVRGLVEYMGYADGKKGLLAFVTVSRIFQTGGEGYCLSDAGPNVGSDFVSR